MVEVHKLTTERSGGCITSTVLNINLVCKNICYARQSILAKLLTNDIYLYNQLQKNQIITVENVVMIKDVQTNIILFSYDKNLKFLINFKTTYVGGTFQYSTQFFYQMFITFPNQF